MDTMKELTAAIATFAILTLSLALWGSIVYVSWHFIAKFW